MSYTLRKTRRRSYKHCLLDLLPKLASRTFDAMRKGNYYDVLKVPVEQETQFGARLGSSRLREGRLVLFGGDLVG
jgi:hypothetical protein